MSKKQTIQNAGNNYPTKSKKEITTKDVSNNGIPVLTSETKNHTSSKISPTGESEKNDTDTLINFTNDLFWSVDTDFKLISANNAFIKNLQQSTGIIIKTGDNLLIKGMFPENYLNFWEQRYRRAMLGECFREEIFSPALNNNESSWNETNFNPIYKEGVIAGVACFARNITDKKLAQEKLRRNEVYLAEARKLAKLGTWSHDFKTGKITWSDELFSVFGTDRQTFLEMYVSSTNMVDEADRDFVLQTNRDVQQTGLPYTITYAITTPSGEKRTIREYGQGETDEKGKVIRTFGTTQDITESVKADEAIKKAFEDKNTILERIDDGFFAIDENSIVTYWNKRAEILLDARREDMIGKNLHEVFANSASKAFYDNYKKAADENITIHFTEFSNRTKKWFSVSAYGSENGLSVYFKDVTEQKNADEKIKESELRYRSLIENAIDCICIANQSFNFIDINPSGCRLFGYNRDEFLQLHISDVVFAEDLLQNPFKIDELKEGKSVTNERRIKRKDGSELIVELSGKMLKNGELMIFCRDITERKETELLIKESEAKYRSFFESSMDGILLTVTNGEILDANPAACEIFRMTKEEIIAAGRMGLVDQADPRLKILLEKRKRDGKVKGELRMIRKDGSKFETEITSAIFIDSLGRERTSMMIRDTTERKEAELNIKESNERYNLISKVTNDMVWDWDLVTGKVYRNREGWKKLFNTGDRDVENELIEDWNKRIHPDDEHIVKQVSDEITKSEKDFFEVECRMMRDDGSYVYIHDRGHIIRNSDGKALRIIGATQDITGRKHAELQVAKSELRFRSLVQNSSDLICIFNDRGYFMYSSPAIKTIFGFDPENTIGKNAFAYLHPDDMVSLKEYLFKMQDGKHDTTPLLRFKNIHGEWRWIECKVTDMTNNPEVAGYVFNCRDITDRKLVEAEMEKLSFIARETSNAVIITNPEGEILWVNEGFTKITEFEFDDVIGKKPGSFLQGEESSPAVIRYMHNKLKHKEAFECDILNYSKFGRKYWLRIQNQPQFDDAGNLKYFFAVETDITKEKEAEEILKTSEECYRYLFNNNPANIFIWDIETFEILEVNDTAIQLYGYKRKEFLTKTKFDISLPSTHDEIREFAAKALQEGNLRFDHTGQHINKYGEKMFMNINSHRIEFKGRNVILALATNITDKVKLENALEKERMLKQQEITQAVITAQEEERQELGAELHDNVNQILAGSLLYLGMAKRELKVDHPYLKETDALVNAAISEIRKLSHTLITPAMDESQFLESIKNLIAAIQKTSGITIDLQASGFEEKTISDKLKLTIYRIVQEQFNNILKHADASIVTIKLIQDNEKTLLSIKDDGVGFDTSKKPDGVGLLNIKTRASLFNGDITIISSPGKGFELRVLFN